MAGIIHGFDAVQVVCLLSVALTGDAPPLRTRRLELAHRVVRQLRVPMRIRERSGDLCYRCRWRITCSSA